MRKAHELDKGIVCEKCGKITYKGKYIAVMHIKSVELDSTGRRETIDRFNLCDECYKIYRKLIYRFMNG